VLWCPDDVPRYDPSVRRWQLERIESSMSSKDEARDWSINDLWQGLLILVTGVLLVILTVLFMRNGQSWLLFMILGIGAFLIGPLMVLIGANAVIQALWSARPRSYREVVADESSRNLSALQTRIAPDSSRSADSDQSDLVQMPPDR
jgi:hypothetical protein